MSVVETPAVENARQLFDAIDDDGSGELDETELQQLCVVSPPAAPAAARSLASSLCSYSRSGFAGFSQVPARARREA